MTSDRAYAYIRKIRNTNKRAYAVKYLMFLIGQGEQPERGSLAYMAAQGVRINLSEIMNGQSFDSRNL